MTGIFEVKFACALDLGLFNVYELEDMSFAVGSFGSTQFNSVYYKSLSYRWHFLHWK